MRKKAECVVVWLAIVGVSLVFSCQNDPPRSKPIPSGFVYVVVGGEVREIPRAVWEFNPGAWPRPVGVSK